ncbi:hypothetical protein, partial [Pseudomonas fluorescens]|uniref:hypothetical protein n=1 Tax=Pseudomonas fluorescens TaxID=294 RepID=UPI002B1D3270
MKNHIRMTFGGDAEFAINWGEIWQAIHDLEVMPSMRALMAAGPALERDHVAGYNCAYLPIIDLRCFDEAMFILM